MKIEASTIEQFFLASGERSEDLRALTRLITEEISENPKLTHGMGTITMLGWKFIDYKPKSAPKSAKAIQWPVIALAPQKHYLSLYIFAFKDGKYLAELYQNKLGKVKCGKSCIKFKKFSDLNLTVLEKLLIESILLS